MGPIRRAGVACALALAACGGGSAAPAPAGEPVLRAASVDPTAQFGSRADAFYWAHLDFRPTWGVRLGHHQYDGVLPDRSPEAVQDEIERLRLAKAVFAATSPGDLSERERLEREVLLTEIRAELYDLEARRQHAENPMYYTGPPQLTPYAARAYAPLEARARAVVTFCEGTPAYLEQARENLAEALPRTWIDTALLQTRGMIEFARGDALEAFEGLEDEDLAEKLEEALELYAGALEEYAAFLQRRKRSATDHFALGEASFLRMLKEKEGVEIELDRLEEIGVADLERNMKALKEAAREINPARRARRVFAMVESEKPEPDEVLEEAREQAARLRRFLVEEEIVTVPSDAEAEVRPSPPFMRWNSAFLSPSGLFEKRPLPSFYYISPPDPSWPARERRAYVPSHGDLLSTTIHELWPGHFLHSLHKKELESKILKTFCTYSTSEGWAHYTEEMMWDQGAGGGDPKLHLGQIGDALLRNARYLAAIGLHAKNVSVREAKKLFRHKAFADPGTARQQAVRGTFDPGYLNYTLGKLMIKKLREDWRAKVGDRYSLRAFHDAFLSHGCAPVPVIRRFMLGENAGPAL